MPRRSLRRAIAASVLLHAALAGLLLVSFDRTPRPPAAALNTNVDSRIVMRFDEEPAVEVVAAPTPVTEVVEPTSSPIEEQPAARVEEPTGGSRPPLAQTVPIPRTLPPEMIAAIRRPTAGPVGAEVVEVPVTPSAIQPASAAAPVAPTAAPPPVAHAPGSPSAPPVHGALPAAKTIVYVLDASGSMGEWGKIARARAALAATLRLQPPTVRFQIVTYNGTARPLVGTGCVAATPENIALAEEKLKGVEAVGRSDHAEGLRVALNLRPDFVLIVTDADDLSAAKLTGVRKQAAKPATVCVAKATADGVAPPRELK